MNNQEKLISNKDKIHTTAMGVDRIKRNLNLKIEDVVNWCIEKIIDPNCSVIKKGKNYYATIDNYIITINSYSYTIITAHLIKK